MSKKKYAVSDDVLINAINTFPISKLMPAAKLVCSTDYAVRFYLDDGRSYFDVIGADICMYTCVGSRRAVTYWVFC